ncbi:Phytoene dehydrogenase-related protein [Streptosporangium subroseum]|uniref:Pyridine nucleotide-disulfide oxidoreductase domain-containing protein 2 n=1 Tax=Streptosporangium subroseum TaxID=106412 RepID=A0A239EJY0_9ACTN|nr:NAD(P)/FAD-dependent oxidoreductase [Streptosporangium subroseum]SNS45080.1 Phytoene dehydrogenase-related protein [Streptosporangium subroseum]
MSSSSTGASSSQRSFDVVFVGAGHNALVAAAYLARAGRSVALLERATEPGGFVRTEELTLPGFLHDTYSALHPLLANGPVFAELGGELSELGLRYVQGGVSTGASLPDGRSAVIATDPGELASELDRLGEGEAWTGLLADLAPHLGSLFPLLGMELTTPAATSLLDTLYADGTTSALPFQELVAGSAYDLITDRFRSEELRSAFLPWPSHVGLGPHDAAGALWASVFVAMLTAGNPVPEGGGGRLIAALVALVERHGGVVVTGAEVDEILTGEGRATGVRTTDGAVYIAAQAVVATTAPDQLYGRLLRGAPGIPAGVRSQAARFRYRRGCFQINLALSGKPHFGDPRLDLGGAINLGRGIAELVTSARQAEDGLLPARPSISWHEPSAVDPGRAPAGSAVVRLQVMDLPLHPVGDAAHAIAAEGKWTHAVAERFADRVIAEAAQHVAGLEEMILARHLLSPADIAAANPNAGPGDSNAGHNALSQGFTQRPMAAHRGGYATAVPGLYLIGAATWPGPGVTGASGRAVARSLLTPYRPR